MQNITNILPFFHTHFSHITKSAIFRQPALHAAHISPFSDLPNQKNANFIIFFAKNFGETENCSNFALANEE